MSTEHEEKIEGDVVDVPPEEADATRAELARVDEAGMFPAPRPEGRALTYREATELGHVLAASGYFKDATSAAQAAVKVMVGSELGFAPMAAIMGVHIVEGRPMIGGNLLAAMLKRDAHYDFTIDELPESHEDLKPTSNGLPTTGRCVVTITYDGERLTPPSTFSIEEAKNAGLVKEKSNWHKYPRKMLFWRALSWAVDFHAPHLAGGVPLLTEGEIEEGSNGGGTGVAEALNPPKAAAPPLTDEKAEALRTQAREIYDELKGLNPTLIVPGKFGNLVRAAEHSHEALQNLVASLTDLVQVEREIASTIDALREKGGDEIVEAALEAAARKPDRRSYLEALQSTLASAPDDEKGGE